MSLDRLPPEILIFIASDCGIDKADIVRLMLASRALYQNLRHFLFHRLSYGYLLESEDDNLLPILNLHGFDFPKRSSRYPPDGTPLLLSSIQDGWITPADLRQVRELRLYSDIKSLHDDEKSIVRLLELLQGHAVNVAHISLYLIRGPGSLNISPQSRDRIAQVFRFLQALPVAKVQFELITDTFQCLELLTQSPSLVLETLLIDASLSNREETRHWQEGLKQFTSLVHLAYRAMSPWAAPSDEAINDHHLCEDFPNLKIIRLISSPNFTALPRSIQEIHIDIGERDQIIHHCFPLITTLPYLRVLYALNRQNTLPRYHGNPMQMPRLPGTAFTTLKTLHAEMPRPDEKLMFFPPGVLETIANCNPTLENVFLPFLSAYDATKLASSDCTRTLRSLEIQSSICRTTTRESSFDVSHLIALLNGPGVPNLEILKWSAGGNPEMAVSRDFISALYPNPMDAESESTPDRRRRRRHNLRVLAVESRLPKPHSPYVFSGILSWGELLQHRETLVKACVREAGSDDTGEQEGPAGVTMESLVKPVTLIVDGVPQDEVAPDLEFPYESPKAVVVHHHRLSEGELAYLRRWRQSGGSSGVTVNGPNEGLVYDFRKSVFEELYFFDLGQIEIFSKTSTTTSLP